jgi:ATP-dependent Clp protease adapter protein ClpS
MTESAVEVITKVKVDVKPPTSYSVIYFNDETTTFEFVAHSLIEVFSYSLDAALAMTKTISEKGSGAAASGLSKELASHLRDLVVYKARSLNYPLVVEIEEDKE